MSAYAVDCAAWNMRDFDWLSSAVQTCLNAGADIMARDADGMNPLHWATFLVKEGRDSSIARRWADAEGNKNGKAPFGLIGSDSALVGTNAYWRFNDAWFC